MKIVLAGGTGFLGRPLATELASRGHQVVVLSRESKPPETSGIRYAAWQPDGSSSGVWAREIDGAEGIVNLAGAGIADRRWSEARKRELLESRVLSTRSLVSAVRAANTRPSVFVQGSAIGYYGTSDTQTFDESFPPGRDFFGDLAQAWEAEAQPIGSLGCRLVFIRSGVALEKDGGALAEMQRPFKFFAGGPVASGRQYLSWIHRDDWIAMVVWALETPSVSGVFNATAPEPVTNAVFSKALGRALHRPSWIPAPAFALCVMFGKEFADIALINGQRVVPAHAQALGFSFKHPTIESALAAIYR
jgi:uncharacterized protein